MLRRWNSLDQEMVDARSQNIPQSMMYYFFLRQGVVGLQTTRTRKDNTAAKSTIL